MYHAYVNLDSGSMGGYECAKKPDEPMSHMMKAAASPDIPRANSTNWDASSSIRPPSKPTNAISASNSGACSGRFDPARDILEITVNRWPHGYAYEYNSLFDQFWLDGGETPCQVARKPFGRIGIANADADAYAYTDCAIDQGYRAVQELKK
jgi:spermidine dehydrogenase